MATRINSCGWLWIMYIQNGQLPFSLSGPPPLQSDSLDSKCSKGCPPSAYVVQISVGCDLLGPWWAKEKWYAREGQWQECHGGFQKGCLMLQASEHFQTEAGRMEIEGLSPFHWPLNFQNPAAVPPGSEGMPVNNSSFQRAQASRLHMQTQGLLPCCQKAKPFWFFFNSWVDFSFIYLLGGLAGFFLVVVVCFCF